MTGSPLSHLKRILAAVALLPVMGGAVSAQPVELTPQPPSLEGSIRSVEGTVTTSITFVNLASATRQIFWLDYSGQRVRYNSLQPGQFYVQSTFLTHPWLVTDGAGVGLAIFLPVAQPGQATLRDPAGPPVQALAAVGHPVAASARLALSGAGLAGQAVFVRAADDGSLSLLDPAGTALVHLPAAPGSPFQLLLDTTRQDMPDGVGLARLLRVEENSSGSRALLALRADNRRGIYRLENGALTLLAVLPDARGQAELAVGGAGQIAYVAPTATGPLALFQSAGGPGVELLRQGQSAVNGVPIGGISDLTGNNAGDLAVRVSGADGSPLAVLRRRGAVLETVAAVGQPVERGRGTGVTGPLTDLRRPRLGPDGTIVFEGVGRGFVNFYAARPGQALTPLLPGPDWNPDPAASDYDIAADGTVALRAARTGAGDASLSLIAPGGAITTVVSGQRAIEPVGRPGFGSGDLLFFLAANIDTPPDRDGRTPVGLFRYRPGDPAPTGVALPGAEVPDRPGARLLSVPQPPSVSAAGATFLALIGGAESLPVPTAVLFRVALDGTLAAGTLAAAEGTPLPNADRTAMLRDLSYTGDGTLVFDGLLPGSGPLIAPAASAAATAGAARSQAATDTIIPLVATGDDLGPGQLQSTLPPLLSLGPDRELFVARFSQSDGLNREGLFTISRSKRVERVAVTRTLAPGLNGPLFNGLVDTLRYIVDPPMVAADGSVAFKALLDPGGAATGPALPFGVFGWNSASGSSLIALSDASLSPGDPPPYQLERWAAGKGGTAYLQARSAAGKARLYQAMGGTLQVIASPGATPVTGGNPLVDLTDFTLAGSGELFLVGVTAAGPGLFHLAQSQAQPLAVAGSAVPVLSDGRGQGLLFGGSFELLPGSSRGDLLFRAMVRARGDQQARRGSFRYRQGKLETLALEGVGVEGERSLAVETLADTLETQNATGSAVAATFSQKEGWALVRSRLNAARTAVVSEVIAQEARGSQPGVRKFAALDAGPLLDREGIPPRTGPVFTINDAGDIAFLASDGKGWGVYQAPHP